MESLNVDLKLPGTVYQGEFIVAVITITNTSDKQLEVSSRLNLNEGDVRLIVSRPSGQTVTVLGVMMVDTPMRTASLEPNESIESGLFISLTDAGFLFEQAGRYRIKAEYDPGGPREMIRSSEIMMQVAAAAESEGPNLSDMTQNENVAKEIALGGAYGSKEAREKLNELAVYVSRKDGAIARLALAAGTENATVESLVSEIAPLLNDHKPIAVAHWVSGVTSSMSPAGEILKKAFLKILIDKNAGTTFAGEIERARDIVLGRPFPN